MDSIQKTYNDEYDRLYDLLSKGEITEIQFQDEVQRLSERCSEQEGLRNQYEQWNVGRPNF